MLHPPEQNIQKNLLRHKEHNGSCDSYPFIFAKFLKYVQLQTLEPIS